MSRQLHDVLRHVIADEFANTHRDLAEGACLRIDDVALADAPLLTSRLREILVDYDVYELSATPSSEWQIGTDRAVELRNRKLRPLVLIVPHGIGDAASSLDNSFDRFSLSELCDAATESIAASLTGTPIAELIRILRRATTATTNLRRVPHPEGWADWLAAVSAEPTLSTAGRELWRLGLVPDLEKDSMVDRIAKNIVTSRAISFPSRPAATVIDRLVAAELRDEVTRTHLNLVLSGITTPLRFATAWCKHLLDHHAGALTFEKWPFADRVDGDIHTLSATSFRKHDGSVETWSKLRDNGGQLTCATAENRPATVGIRWTTNPTRVSSVARWRVELLPPLEFRDGLSAPVITKAVKGDKRAASIKMELTEDDLDAGHRFVLVITALDEDGNEMRLTNGELAQTETDEFDVLVDDEPAPVTQRSSTASSVAHAVLKAAVEGFDSSETDEVCELEQSAGILRIRLGNRRQAQMQLSPLLVDLQQRTISNPLSPVAYSARSVLGQVIDFDSISMDSLTLPPGLAKGRKHVLTLLSRDSRRAIAESVRWDDELRNAVNDYVQAYRRALDSADDAQLTNLLRLETLSIRLRTPSDEPEVVVVLPLHPLRLFWIMTHDGVLRSWANKLTEYPRARRASLVDIELSERISPKNLPFTVISSSSTPLIHIEELSHGCGVYLPTTERSPELTIELVFRALGLRRESAALRSRTSQTRDRVDSYLRAHTSVNALRVVGMNPGQGELIAQVVRPLVTVTPEAAETSPSYEDRPTDRGSLQLTVISYMDDAPFNDPMSSLRQIQQELRVVGGSEQSSHLNPPLSVAVRPIERIGLDDQNAHIAIVQDIATAEVSCSRVESERAPVFRELLTPTHTVRDGDGSQTVWMTRPGLKSQPETGSNIAAVHRAHQHAVARAIGHPGELPAVHITLGPDAVAALRMLHARTDWVITVDRFIGIDLYEDAQEAGLGSAYLLDYAPDFVEGLTERLTVTTAHRHEALRVLEHAMDELGLAHLGSETLVLETLAMVSGRLALRLLGDDGRAREAVSLAALMTYLRSRGELDGLIVVPVDAHPEIFGASRRLVEEGSRRCDLLLVRITQRAFSIECVEVKARQGAVLPNALADRIVEQLKDTEDLLLDRFFGDESERLDRDLQRTQMAALLHYYADRSFLNGLVTKAELTELHRQIDRNEATQRRPEITLRGYVIALDGNQGFPANAKGVPIDVLTADELGHVGFTTKTELQEYEARSRSIALSDLLPVGARSTSTVPGVAQVQETARLEPPNTPDFGHQPRDPLPITTERAQLPPSPAPPQAAASEASALTGESNHGPAQPEAPQQQGQRVPSTESPDVSPPEASARRLPAIVSVALGRNSASQEAVWNVSTKGSPHAFIVGIPGQGKSVTTRRIIDSFSEQGLPSIVFDFHGDMAAQPPVGATVLDVAETGLPFSPFELRSGTGDKVNVAALEVAEIVGYVCELGEIQTGHVYQGLKAAYQAVGWADGVEGQRLPTIEEFADAVEAVEKGAKGKNARDRLRPLTDFGLFRNDAAGVFDPTAGGRGLVVDVSNVVLERVQLAAAAFMLRRIYREMFKWPLDGAMRLAVVLDEAHRLAKDKTLPKLMKEGRKYGVSVVVASQGLSDFKQDVVRNAGAKIVFRTNFPDSKSVAGFLRGRDGADLSQQIEGLDVGQAFVATPDDAKARKVFMYE